MKFLFSLITVVMLAESCKPTNESIDSNASDKKNVMAQNTLSGTYRISKLEGHTEALKKITITFDDASKKVSGFTGCNSFFGSYTVDGDNITFSAIGASKKYCPQQAKVERLFLDVISNTNTFSAKDNTISFFNNGTQLLSGNLVTTNKSVSTDISENYSNTVITYKALSRGTFEYVQVSKSGVKISSDRNLKTINTYTCKTKDWEALDKMLSDIQDLNLSKLKAPTDKRLFDGAAHATLTILRDDIAMETPSFDHGHPPTEIQELVNKVLSIKENSIKQ